MHKNERIKENGKNERERQKSYKQRQWVQRSYGLRVGSKRFDTKTIRQFSKVLSQKNTLLIERTTKNNEKKRRKTTSIYYWPKGTYILMVQIKKITVMMTKKYTEIGGGRGK